MKLNERAVRLCDAMMHNASLLRIAAHTVGGAHVVDAGIDARGGLEAGVWLSEVCLAGLGKVSIVPRSPSLGAGPAVQVRTDHPLAACMASQYAGWQVSGEKYFAMGSGPMRAAAGREALFERIGYREQPDSAVGVLETGKFPPPAVVEDLAQACGVEPAQLRLVAAPTSSQAGTVQVVARSIETAMHKLFELDFDLTRVESGYGIAPLPPVARNDLEAIGRTNDAILYGAEVSLWVRGDDESLADIGPRVPSGASADHGQPFAAIFERYGRDFYKIDPHLFSPAVIAFHNLDSGRTHRFGTLSADILRQSLES